ncbi:MAG: aminoacyl-tRNA hydrolase [Candidatus Marinimicrobia bacterium]|nr:aminoacyl-tRNA hydrolase [Candidatus Neomarinimicrobiota bacterium]
MSNYTIIGLGNPGEEYENTRHNTGWIVSRAFCKEQKFDAFEEDNKIKALKTKGEIGKNKVVCLLPLTFMNKSGSPLKKIITSKKKAEKLILIQDEVDIPLGKWKISFGKNSAGHKGVESVMRAVKTKDFYRVRVGISPSTPKGKIKKPKGEKVLDFLMGKFKPKELAVLKKISKKINEDIEKLILQKR